MSDLSNPRLPNKADREDNELYKNDEVKVLVTLTGRDATEFKISAGENNQSLVAYARRLILTGLREHRGKKSLRYRRVD